VIDKVEGKIKWVRSTGILAVLTLLFSSILFFYDLLGGRYLLTERDLGPYFIPPRFFWVESIKRGDFPLWNPYQFSGHPFFANPQHAILYPLNSLFLFLPFDVAFNGIIILHFFLGGLFTYLFLRDLKVNVTGSLISGLIFMLSGYLLSVHSLLTILLSSIWTPLVMMFFRRAIYSRGLKNEILTAIFISISFLGGGIEIVYGNFFLLFFMVIFSSLPDATFVGDKPRRYKFVFSLPIYKFFCSVLICWGRMKPLFKRFRSLLIVSILFLFLSAIQLVPFLELFIHSIRGKGISYQEATTWSLAPKDTLLFFLPDAYGYFLDMKKYWITQCWLKTLYTGGLPFILSLIFFFAPHLPLSPSGEREGVRGFGKDRKLYLSLILFSLFLSLGYYNPLYPFVFKYVPFFNGIRYPVKFLYIFILVLSVTAGLGFQRLSEFSKVNQNKRLKNLLILFSLASGFLLLSLALRHQGVEGFLRLHGVDYPHFNHLSVNLYHAKRFLFYLALFFLLLRVGYEVRWKGWIKILLIFFLATDLFGNMGFYGKEKTSDYFRKTKISEIISSDKGHFRIFSTGKTISLDTPILIGGGTFLDAFKEKHLPTMNLLYPLHDIWGIDVIRLKRVDDLYKTFIGTPSISATNLIDLYGVKYIISVTPIEEDSRFQLVYSRLEGLVGKREDLLKENTIKLYKNRSAFPRAWLVKDYRILDSNKILSTITSKDFHPDKEVLLEEEPKWETENPPSPPHRRQSGSGASETFTKGGLGGLGDPFHGLSNKVEFISETNNKLQIMVRAEKNSLLFLSDTYHPGWKTFVHPVRYDSYNQVNLVDTNLSNRVNEREVKILRANYNFRAIPLEAGEYEIKFIYDPISFKIGFLVSLLTLVGIVAYLIKKGGLKSK
jgi:hypothetical protein